MKNQPRSIADVISSLTTLHPTPHGYRMVVSIINSPSIRNSSGHPTQFRIRQLLSYDQETGFFRWRVSRPRVRAGQVAGRVGKDGYVIIGVDGRQYSAHRLAFVYMLGEYPRELIDHVNGNPSDNSWKNLRIASNSQNQMNTSRKANNTSGHKGVSWSMREKSWRADIRIDGKKVFLGYFETREAAHAAYADAARQHHGAFARAA